MPKERDILEGLKGATGIGPDPTAWMDKVEVKRGEMPGLTPNGLGRDYARRIIGNVVDELGMLRKTYVPSTYRANLVPESVQKVLGSAMNDPVISKQVLAAERHPGVATRFFTNPTYQNIDKGDPGIFDRIIQHLADAYMTSMK